MGAQDEFEKLPEWLQKLWEGAPNIARKCEAELAALRARVEQAERERDEARARVAELEAATESAGVCQNCGHYSIDHDADGIHACGLCDCLAYASRVTLTPRLCETCAQEAAREMREKCAEAVRKLAHMNSAYEDAIRALPLPSCDGCNPLKPEAKDEATR